MTQTDIETIYEAMAKAIDTAGSAKTELLLAKFVLLLSQEINDTGKVLALLDNASCHLDP